MKTKDLQAKLELIEEEIEDLEKIVNRPTTWLYLMSGDNDGYSRLDIEKTLGKDVLKDIDWRLKGRLIDLRTASKKISEKLNEDIKIVTQTFEL